MSKRLSYYWTGGTTNDQNPELINNRFKQINSGSWNITGNVISKNESIPPIKDHNLENESVTESEPVVKNKLSALGEGVWNLFNNNYTIKSPNNGSSNDFDLEELEDLSKLRDMDFYDKYEHPIYDDSESPIYDEYKNELSTKKTDLLKQIDDILQKNKNQTRGGTRNRIQLGDKPDKDEFIIPKKDEEYVATYGDDFVYTQREMDNHEFNPNMEKGYLQELNLMNEFLHEDDAYGEANSMHQDLIETVGEQNALDLIDFLSKKEEDFETNESILEDEDNEDYEETLDDMRLNAQKNNRQRGYLLRKPKKVKYALKNSN